MDPYNPFTAREEAKCHDRYKASPITVRESILILALCSVSILLLVVSGASLILRLFR